MLKTFTKKILTFINHCKHEYKHFVAWYKLLRKQYGILTSFSCALYNYRYYDIDGNYKQEYTVDGYIQKSLALKRKNK